MDFSSANISKNIIDVIGPHLEERLQETVMKAMVEMSHTYFPKVVPNLRSDTFDISQIIVPPYRLQQLRYFLKKPTAHFTCPEQAALLELMVLRTRSVLVVLGTGSGKTFIILMQAWLQKELVTIVILPLYSLHDNFQRRAFKIGVRTVVGL